MRNTFIITLILISLLINVFSFNKVHDWGDDFAGYVIQAKTIHTGNYSALEANMERNDFILNYPWGFPFIISPVIKYFDTNIVIIKIYIFLFFLAALIVIFYLFREKREAALLTVLLVSSSPFFWEFKNYIISDIPNLFSVLLTLFIANLFLIKRKAIVNEYFTCFIIGALIYISYMIRNQSIILLPSITLVQIIIFRRHLFKLRKILMVFVPAAVFLFFVFISSQLIPIKSVTYLDQYANLQLGKTIWENVFYYTNVWQELFASTYIINNIVAVFTGFFITFAFIGVSIEVRQNILFIVFCSSTILLVLISPFHQGIRYLLPLVPFFFYFFIIGFKYSVFRICTLTKFKYPVYYLIVGVIVLLSIKTISMNSYHISMPQHEMEGPYKKTSIEMFTYIRDSSSKNQIIGFLKPRAMLLYANRNSVVPISYEECIKRNIDYLVYYRNSMYDKEQLQLEVIKSHNNNFREVFQNEDFIVFKEIYKRLQLNNGF